MTAPSVWDYQDNLDYDLPLNPDDPRLVPLNDARGDFSERRIIKALRVDPTTLELHRPPARLYLLFGGHRGCGKSTELRRLAAKLDGPERYLVVFVDALVEVDIHNLRYSDLLLAQAKALVAALEARRVPIDPVHVARLEDWFKERVEAQAKTRELAAEIRAGAQAKAGLPWVGRLFAGLTSSVRTNSTYKEELRTIVRNSFADLAEGFNLLLRQATRVLQERGTARGILFVIDGTDRLGEDDQCRFFINDIHQLKLIDASFIYCAPISLLTKQAGLHQGFDGVFRLPMVKLGEKADSAIDPAARALLRDFIFKRVPQECFDRMETVDYLIDHCGGHPRDLLRLLNYAFQDMDGERFDRPSAESAVRRLAVDYKRLLEPEDYRLLAEIDRAPADYAPVTPRSRSLRYNLALLEYNGFWWRSHPVVRTLNGYAEAVRALAEAD
jgi:hypothetical protein